MENKARDVVRQMKVQMGEGADSKNSLIEFKKEFRLGNYTVFMDYRRRFSWFIAWPTNASVTGNEKPWNYPPVTPLFGNRQHLAHLPFEHCTIPVFKGFWWADISYIVLSTNMSPEEFLWTCDLQPGLTAAKRGILWLLRWGKQFICTLGRNKFNIPFTLLCCE